MTSSESETIGVVRNPTVLGALALPVIGVVVLGSLGLGQWFLSANSEKLISATPVWEIPYFVGWSLGAASVALAGKLTRSRLAEWFVHFETWFHTFQYRGESDP